MVSEIDILTKFRQAICYKFIIKCTTLEKILGFSINMQIIIIIFQIKCILPTSPWPVRISMLTTCVM